ncbi:MAG: hypothetical protein AB7H70_02375 [Rhodospirillaceae bacterium]
MYAIYFNDSAGGRSFIAAVDDKHSAMSMAKLLSRQDPRDVVVVENRVIGDTVLLAVFRRGARQADEQDSDLAPERTPSATDASGEHA